MYINLFGLDMEHSEILNSNKAASSQRRKSAEPLYPEPGAEYGAKHTHTRN